MPMNECERWGDNNGAVTAGRQSEVGRSERRRQRNVESAREKAQEMKAWYSFVLRKLAYQTVGSLLN